MIIKTFMGLMKQNILSMFLPDTYEIYWNISTENLFKKMNNEYNKFWNKKREDKLNKLNINKIDVSILASIVASETLKIDEANTIAGVIYKQIK